MLFLNCNDLRFLGVFVILLASILITGCMKNPWGDPLSEKISHDISLQLTQREEERGVCSKIFDAEATITLKAPLNEQALSGFVQVLRPYHIKMVALNPLGQPLFAIITDQHSFQLLNTPKKEFSNGKLRSLALKYDLPMGLVRGNWGDRFFGALPTTIDPANIFMDSHPEGFWIKSEFDMAGTTFREYHLVSVSSYQLQSIILTDSNDNKLARIDYSNWQKKQNCDVPGRLKISGLPKGVEVDIKFSDIYQGSDLTKNDFTIQLPPGYIQHQYR